jgi:hypothetical protein
MHALKIRAVLLAVLVAALAAGCGSAAGGGSSGPVTTAQADITGVVMKTTSDNLKGGTAAADVKVGLYLQPVHSGGPIAADPPQPVATVRTDANGTFRFADLKPGTRYFVFALGAPGYSIGHWARPGGSVRLVACTDCAMPL